MLNKKNTENYTTLFIILFTIFIFASAAIKGYIIIKLIIAFLFAIFLFLKKDKIFKTKSYFNFLKFVGGFCLTIGSIIFIIFLIGLYSGPEIGAEWIFPLILSIFLIVGGIVYLVKFK